MSEFLIAPLSATHLADAAGLVAEGKRRQRAEVPELPGGPGDRAEVVELLEGLGDRYPGVAAIAAGGLVGFLTGMPVPAFKGRHRGVYCPEWAHGARGPNRAWVYRRMYAELAKSWVEAGCFTHAVTMFACDREAIEAWYWNGLGLLVVDAVRDLNPIDAPVPPGLVVRRLGPDEAELISELGDENQRYLAGAPIFLPFLAPRRLGAAQHLLLVAFKGDFPVAYMRMGPASDRAARALFDPGTASITGAYTRPAFRNAGVGAALLSELVEAARSQGYRRVAVDFESANLLGTRFWLRYFRPVCYSAIRYLDDRVAWAGPDRRCQSMW